MATKQPRASYAAMFGPTVGDKVGWRIRSSSLKWSAISRCMARK